MRKAFTSLKDLDLVREIQVVVPWRTVEQHTFLEGFKMASFLHCNACYFRPGMAGHRNFYITNCSHIYCATCVQAATKGSCKVCKTPCSTLCLNGKIPKEVESLFADPWESFQKAFKEAQQRMEFQKSHQKRLLRHVTQQMQVMQSLVKQVQKLENEKQLLKEQNEYLVRMMQKKSNPRGNQRSGLFRASPGSSSPVTLKQTSSGDQQTLNSGVNFLPQHGRISMRTPPLGGCLGTSLDQSYPSSGENVRQDSPLPTTPLTIPRPINFGRGT